MKNLFGLFFCIRFVQKKTFFMNSFSNQPKQSEQATVTVLIKFLLMFERLLITLLRKMYVNDYKN